jgi:hypothetical protein
MMTTAETAESRNQSQKSCTSITLTCCSILHQLLSPNKSLLWALIIIRGNVCRTYLASMKFIHLIANQWVIFAPAAVCSPSWEFCKVGNFCRLYRSRSAWTKTQQNPQTLSIREHLSSLEGHKKRGKCTVQYSAEPEADLRAAAFIRD